jgi:selenocysteine lyase/cysteine desulfurase
VSRLDHDANVRPWIIAADKAGVVVRWADFDPATGELPVANRPGGVVVVGGDQAPISQKHTRIGGVSNVTESPFGGNRFEV